jgi:3-deoxy-7-phosphoheptulonate synthase
VISQKVIPTAAALKTTCVLTPNGHAFIENTRKSITHILNGDDKRLLLIVGPCSIHSMQSSLEYAKNLKQLSDEVSDTFLILMRTYFEKPRTTSGWKGFLYDPDMDGSYDIEKGLTNCRKFLIELNNLEIPVATEFLDPLAANYFSDLISWGCIGARTAESQTHRQLASNLDLPISFKNNTSGNVDIAINGILTASIPHTCLSVNEEGLNSIIKTKGNPTCHLTLRGGDNKPNYDPESIDLALKLLEKAHLPKRLLVDCSHGNSARNHLEQCNVFQSVMHQIVEGNHNIKGLILESDIHSGNQTIPSDLSTLQYGVSVTDACLDFKTTATLIKWAFERLKKNETLVTKANHS